MCILLFYLLPQSAVKSITSQEDYTMKIELFLTTLCGMFIHHMNLVYFFLFFDIDLCLENGLLQLILCNEFGYILYLTTSERSN